MAAWLARLVSLIALLELSGFAHSLADFIEVVVEHGHHESDCDDEQGGRPCDPGCSGCHCAHGSPTVTPADRSGVESLHATAQLESISPDSLRAPSPDRAPPFRPPRAA